jgi:heme o synthase
MRPLPSGRISVRHATAFTWATGIAGCGILWWGTNPLTAALGLGTILTYRFIYTPMKVRTPWNTFVGSVVGSIPPVMGWTAATGTVMGTEPLVLFLTLFLWQVPHFMGIAWRHRKDYSAAGYKMLPQIHPDGRSTALLSLWSVVAMGAIPFWTAAAGMTSSMFMIDGTLLNAWLGYHAWKFYKVTSNENANSLFRKSIFYLLGFIFLMFFHAFTYRFSLWSPEDDDVDLLTSHETNLDRITNAVGRKLCVHESITGKNDKVTLSVPHTHGSVASSGETGSAALCPMTTTSSKDAHKQNDTSAKVVAEVST